MSLCHPRVTFCPAIFTMSFASYHDHEHQPMHCSLLESGPMPPEEKVRRSEVPCCLHCSRSSQHPIPSFTCAQFWTLVSTLLSIFIRCEEPDLEQTLRHSVAVLLEVPPLRLLPLPLPLHGLP